MNQVRFLYEIEYIVKVPRQIKAQNDLEEFLPDKIEYVEKPILKRMELQDSEGNILDEWLF